MYHSVINDYLYYMYVYTSVYYMYTLYYMLIHHTLLHLHCTDYLTGHKLSLPP